MSTDVNEIVDVDDLDDELDGGEVMPPKTPVAQNDELKAAIAELTGNVNKLATPKPDPEPELTQEQKNEFWAVYNPEATNKDFMKKWFRLNPDATEDEIKEVKAMWSEVQQGLVKQAVVGSRNLMQLEFKKRDEQIAKLQEYYSKQEAKETRSRFEESFPALADKKYSKILSLVAKDLASGEYKDEASFFKALAEGAAGLIDGENPAALLGAGQTNKPKSAGTSPRLPRTSVGGTGGASGGKQGAISVKGDATDEFLDED